MRKIHINDHVEALVSDGDFDRLSKMKWHLAHGYAVHGIYTHGIGSRQKAMHHYVLPQKPGFVTDHIDRNPLNNQRENLRYATFAQNSRNSFRQRNNSSGFKGVSWLERDKRWTVWIHIDGQNRYLGSFQDKYEAAYAYNRRAIEVYGDFSWLNSIPESFVPSAGMTAKRRKDGRPGFRGVTTRNKGRTWFVRTVWEKSPVSIGPFDSAVDAAYVFDQVALQLYGSKARLNLL
jgi:hypothetical protein